jgi:hypothetical protein
VEIKIENETIQRRTFGTFSHKSTEKNLTNCSLSLESMYIKSKNMYKTIGRAGCDKEVGEMPYR